MKRSVFLVIAALLAFVFGIGLWARPVHMMFMFDVGLDPSGVLMARMLGIAMIAMALVLFIARNAPDSSAMSGILWGGVVQNVLSAGLVVRMMSEHWMNMKATTAIVLHVLLAIGFLAFLSKKKMA